MRAIIIAHLLLQVAITAIAIGCAAGTYMTPLEAGLVALLVGAVGGWCTTRAADTLRILEDPTCAD